VISANPANNPKINICFNANIYFMIKNNQFNGKNYDEVWTDRFNFYQQNGEPNSKTFRIAFKSLPMMKRMRMNINFYAFLFGIIYFLIKGMWKGAITLLAISTVVIIISLFLPDSVSRYIGFPIAYLGAFTANYTFYRKEVLGENDFNIFKGMY
jgi:Protein of unknown function (DUF2628)